MEKGLIQAVRQLHGGERNGLEGMRYEPDQEEWSTLRWRLDPEGVREQSRDAACCGVEGNRAAGGQGTILQRREGLLTDEQEELIS